MLDHVLELAKHLPAAATVLFTILTGLLLSGMLKRLIDRLHLGGHMPMPMVGRLHGARRVGIWMVALLVVLQATGLFAQAWALASAILAALAIGFFAAWSILSNMTSTLIILALRPFRVGDRVELVEPTNGTSIGGNVLDLNLIYTTFEELAEDGSVRGQLQVPNNLLLQKLIRVHPPADGPNTDVEAPFFRRSTAGE